MTACDVVVKAESEGLGSESVTVKAVSAPVRKGVSVIENITCNPYADEIPVRKIELTRNTGIILTPDCPSSEVTAVIYPENATYKELFWKIVTNSGIETKVASLSVSGNKAVVTPVETAASVFAVTVLTAENSPKSYPSLSIQQRASVRRR